MPAAYRFRLSDIAAKAFTVIALAVFVLGCAVPGGRFDSARNQATIGAQTTPRASTSQQPISPQQGNIPAQPTHFPRPAQEVMRGTSNTPQASANPGELQAAFPNSDLSQADQSAALFPDEPLFPDLSPKPRLQNPGTDNNPRDLSRPDLSRSGIHVGFLLPLSGPFAATGEALRQGAILGLFTINQPDLYISFYDTAASSGANSTQNTIPTGNNNNQGPEQAARNAAAAAIADGAQVLVGPLLAQSVEAIKPLAMQANVPVISFSNSSRVAGGPVVIMGNLPSSQVRAIAASAIEEGRSRFALIAPDNAYGRLVGESLSSFLAQYRLSLVDWAFFPPQTENFSAIARRLANFDERTAALSRHLAQLQANPANEANIAELRRLRGAETFGDPPFDTLLVAINNPEQLFILTAQLSLYDIDPPAVRLLGLGPWENLSGLAREPALLNARFPVTRPPEDQNFAQYFSKFFNNRPTRMNGLGFDAAVVAMKILAEGLSLQNLMDSSGFAGANGFFRFTQQGLTERGYAIMEVTTNGVVMITPPAFPAG